MPRKKITYTHLYPYHVTARSNNKEWFYISKEILWELLQERLNALTTAGKLKSHALVLMDNHYHLLCSTNESYNLGEIMCWLQTSLSKEINRRTGRINHVFGGPYKGSIILNPHYYYFVFKYVYQNPLRANIINKVEDYLFSSLHKKSKLLLQRPEGGIDALVEVDRSLDWLNTEFDHKMSDVIRKGLKKTTFKYVYSRRPRQLAAQKSVRT